MHFIYVSVIKSRFCVTACTQRFHYAHHLNTKVVVRILPSPLPVSHFVSLQFGNVGLGFLAPLAWRYVLESRAYIPGGWPPNIFRGGIIMHL